MISKFQRPEESEQYVKELDDYLVKMRESLNELAKGAADLNNTKKFIYSLIEEQDENGFWALIPSPKVDGDIRVHYWYKPTYIAAAIMMVYYRNYRNEAEGIAGFEEALKKGLEASTGRGLKGHGYDDIRGRLEALDIFAKGGVIKFTNDFPEISSKFSTMITDIVNWLSNCVNTDNTNGDWSEDYKVEMEKILEMLSIEEKNEYVWYASYGSNMLYERFLLYIKGGHCVFNGKNYAGCRDKSMPKDSKPITIPYNMYYGNKTSSWGEGGVSFLDLSSSGKALGRMYLITVKQFEDVSRQEGSSSNWYNEIVSLGEYEGVKILTITNKSKRECCVPSDGYIDVVKRGIKETYPKMSSLDIMEYLVECSK